MFVKTEMISTETCKIPKIGICSGRDFCSQLSLVNQVKVFFFFFKLWCCEAKPSLYKGISNLFFFPNILHFKCKKKKKVGKKKKSCSEHKILINNVDLLYMLGETALILIHLKEYEYFL